MANFLGRNVAKSMRPGGGGKFAKLKGELSHKPGITNPGALAASIGRKKYGQTKMNSFSETGKARAARKALKGM